MLSYFVDKLSKTLHINFYQNRSNIIEVMTTKFWFVFMPHSVLYVIFISHNVVVTFTFLHRYCDFTVLVIGVVAGGGAEGNAPP